MVIATGTTHSIKQTDAHVQSGPQFSGRATAAQYLWPRGSPSRKWHKDGIQAETLRISLRLEARASFFSVRIDHRRHSNATRIRRRLQ